MAPLDTVFFALPALSSATASFPRIQKYLCHDEQVDGRSKKATYISTKATNISANSEASARIFSDLSIDLEPGNVTMLCGPVGCGKTAVLKALLGEIPLQAGFIEAPLTPLGYADQVVWLRNVSIRDNICQEGFDFDETWYRQVLVGCALDQDVASLPEGDRTAVGSSATNISGGQKQRLVRIILCFVKCLLC
jgi:ABC-type bacteriocin/lantibiotic exporter with double-glycine peptidase domain